MPNRDSSLSLPAAGEVETFADEGEPSFGAQQGSTRTRIPEKSKTYPQGAKTTAKNREMTHSGSPDQGTF